MDRITSTAVAVVGFVMAILGLAAALGGSVAPGVVPESNGAAVLRVDPGSFAWRDGIRPGQEILALHAADEPGGWVVETEAGTMVIRSAAAPYARLLQALQPLAVASVAVAVGAVLLLPRRRRAAEALGSTAVVLASVPLIVEGQLPASSAAAGLALLMPVAWLARWTTFSVGARAAILALAVGIVIVWLVFRILGEEGFIPIDQLRLALVVVATLAMVATAVDWHRRDFSMVTRPRLIDAASLAILGALVALLLLARIPLLAVALLVAGVVVLYPAFRRIAVSIVDRAFLAEQRERATITAAEAERARLARELHDTPLQELAGVIKHLEVLPGAEQQEVALRRVTDDLRRLTSELHPPVLDDLGVVAAIEHMADQLRLKNPGVAISVGITERTGVMRSERPPSDVELNLFRVVQEAVANALRHAHGAAVRISGDVSPAEVHLMVADNGVGLAERAADEALRAGRLGLPSMRRRAEAIGAHLEIRGGSGNGTQVSIEWEASR
jgi:signal transduction histidine kinase